jgi:hypothetical protein
MSSGLKAARDAERRESAERALVVVEVPADRLRFEDALVLLQPLWVRIGWHVAGLIMAILAVVGVVAALGGQVHRDGPQTEEPSAPPGPTPGLSLEQRWRLRLLMIPGVLAYGSVLLLRRLALRRRIEEWYQHASRTGADRIDLHEDRLVLRDCDVPWSAVSDAAEVDCGRTRFLAVRARGLWGILPADTFKKGDLAGARSLMMRKLDGSVRVVIV